MSGQLLQGYSGEGVPFAGRPVPIPTHLLSIIDSFFTEHRPSSLRDAWHGKGWCTGERGLPHVGIPSAFSQRQVPNAFSGNSCEHAHNMNTTAYLFARHLLISRQPGS